MVQGTDSKEGKNKSGLNGWLFSNIAQYFYFCRKPMDNFIKPVDDLSALIEQQAQVLYQKLFDLPIQDLNLPDVPLKYYLGRHHDRKFFSVQTAAELLYRSIKLKGKPLEELVIMDYGAGMGSLFLLAKMIGIKKVVYNDILEDMKEAAVIIAQYLKIPIDTFIVGGHRETIAQLQAEKIQCDIILSRNVVEHIYDLNDFYGAMSTGQPNALIYFSTTANYQNPAMLWYHKKLHKRHEKQYAPKRKELIRKELGQLPEPELEMLAVATRGLAMNDFEKAINDYKQRKTIPDPNRFYTNTCDPENGLWSEQIIKVADYKNIIEPKGYKLTVLPAFWDTHYSSALKNIVGKTMNLFTGLLGQKGGLTTTAFIYVIAEKKKQG